MNAETPAFATGSFSSYGPMSTPMRRTRSPCCARAASGHAAAPPKSVMNSRRLMTSSPFVRVAFVDRSSRKRIGILNWDFCKNQPAERHHLRVSGEHVATVDVLGLAASARAIRARGPHLGELRHPRQPNAGRLGIAQHQVNVAMDDQAALPIDHIGLPALADVHLGYRVPDKLEIDLGDADASVEPGASERQRHIGGRGF